MSPNDRIRARRREIIERQRRWDDGDYPPVAYEAAKIAAERVPPPGRMDAEVWSQNVADKLQQAVAANDSRSAQEMADAIAPGLEEDSERHERLSGDIARVTGMDAVYAHMEKLAAANAADAEKAAEQFGPLPSSELTKGATRARPGFALPRSQIALPREFVENSAQILAVQMKQHELTVQMAAQAERDKASAVDRAKAESWHRWVAHGLSVLALVVATVAAVAAIIAL